ncbi:MAG TPA: alpha/beta hydrolase [Rhizomicrobium sp.]|nr:alpha/beta hydrolase [Rhizomicrobium sp.]
MAEQIDRAAYMASEGPLTPFHGAVPPAPAWFTRTVAVEPESAFVEVEGAKIHYLRWGDRAKPGLLLVHGNAAHAYWWSFIAPYLAGDYNVAAMDFSGMGDSDWRKNYSAEIFSDEQMAVCEAAGMFAVSEPPVIVAHSFGGFITMLTGCRYGDRLAGTVIVDSPVNPPGRPGGPPNRTFKPHNVYPDMAKALSRFRLMPPQTCDNLYIVDWVARRSLKAVAQENGQTGFTWKFDPFIWQDFSIGDTAARLKATKCRIGIFRGAESVLMPPEIGEYMFNLLGRAAPVVTIPEAKHHVMLDQPLALVSALNALLADWNHSIPNRKV